MNRRRSRADEKRIAAIRGRLRDGFSETEIKQAILGCSYSRFHMGQNDAGIRYNDITLICRNAAKIEQFLEFYFSNPKRQAVEAAELSAEDSIESNPESDEAATSDDWRAICYVCGGSGEAIYNESGRLQRRPCHRCRVPD